MNACSRPCAAPLSACRIHPETMNNTKPISILLCALGGEGGGVLTEWLI